MNAYTSLIETASRLAPTDVLDDVYWGESSDAQKFLDANSELLSTVRRTLTTECRIPIRNDKDFMSDHSDDYLPIRNLAKALTIELRYLESTGQAAAAASVGIDMLRLANILRSGLIVDLLVGIAIEGMALDGMRRFRRTLNRQECKNAISELHTLEVEREAYTEVADRDRKWEREVEYEDMPLDMSFWELSDSKECGSSEEEQMVLRDYIVHLANLPDAEKSAIHLDLDRQMLAMSRLLRTELSLQYRFAIEKAYPTELNCDDLVDPTSGIDPFTDELFVYRRITPESFTLYSPAPTRIDHGGKFGSWRMVASGKADLCLDMSEYEECCESTCPPRSSTMFDRIKQGVKRWISSR